MWLTISSVPGIARGILPGDSEEPVPWISMIGCSWHARVRCYLHLFASILLWADALSKFLYACGGLGHWEKVSWQFAQTWWARKANKNQCGFDEFLLCLLLYACIYLPYAWSAFFRVLIPCLLIVACVFKRIMSRRKVIPANLVLQSTFCFSSIFSMSHWRSPVLKTSGRLSHAVLGGLLMIAAAPRYGWSLQQDSVYAFTGCGRDGEPATWKWCLERRFAWLQHEGSDSKLAASST